MAYSTRSFGFGSMLTPVVKRLLIANVAVFAVMLVPGADRIAIDWFAFQPTRIFIRPWGVFTYMFIHGGFMHVAMNMLVLFFFGPPLESRWGGREFFKYYVICGLGGVALSYLFLPAAVIGASAAIYGVMLAFAMNWPDAPIYVWGIFPVKAKWLVAFFFVLTLVSAFSPFRSRSVEACSAPMVSSRSSRGTMARRRALTAMATRFTRCPLRQSLFR